jgi:predicted ATPase
MIENIIINNYKCFKNNTINLNKASLLLGTNSGGKSSFIQALLLSHMSLKCIANGKKSLDLITNTYGLNLYSFDEVIYTEAVDDFFSVRINSKEGSSKLEFRPTDDNNVVEINLIGDKSKYSREVVYLSSDRSISKYQKGGDINNIHLGQFNEYLGYILEKGRQKNVIKIDMNRNHWESKDTSVLDIQINNWLSYILPKSRVAANNTGIDNYFSLLFGEKSPLHQTNVGYGISFVLPIIIAGLIAKENSILIVENPELHLHPQAQSNIASFLAVIAASGVQVIIETHSEHIVNGFRKAVLFDENPLDVSELTINYFNINENCFVEEVRLNERAEITYWPEGFMDQEERDLLEIRRLRFKK